MNLFTVIQLIFLFGCCYGKLNEQEECLQDESLINGCSIPWGIEFPYKEFFKPACDRHDVCYSCGARFHWVRSECDEGFKKDMKYLCHAKEQSKSSNLKWSFFSWTHWKDVLNEIKGSWLTGRGMLRWLNMETGSLEHCLNGVDVYYNAIKYFARKNYETIPERHCSYECAKTMGNPHIGLKNGN